MVWTDDVCIDSFEYPNQRNSIPTSGLDYSGAVTACAEQGKRLCTEAEWEASCAGPSGTRRWPYGDTFRESACALRQDLRNGATVSPSGKMHHCVTPEGIFDLSGNLWEWVATEDGSGALRGGGGDFSEGMGQCSARAENRAGTLGGVRCCLD